MFLEFLSIEVCFKAVFSKMQVLSLKYPQITQKQKTIIE